MAGDMCGDRPTFVGGGPSAWSTGGGPASVPSAGRPTRTSAASSAPPCGASPRVRLTTRKVGPGQLEATLAAETAPGEQSNSLSSVRIGSIVNAAVTLDGNPDKGRPDGRPPGRHPQATLRLDGHAPAQNTGLASAVSFVVTDGRVAAARGL